MLAYHEIVDAELFRAQLEHLNRHYAFVGLSEVIGTLQGETDVGRSCWVTFDDGDRTVIDIALPILEELDVPATIFICPSVVGTKDPLWWQLVKRAADLGVPHNGQPVTYDLIASLKRFPDEARRDVVREIAGALERTLGRPFEYPQIELSDLQRWQSTGRTIGNHTWEHPILDRCSPHEQGRQIELAHDWLSGFLGHHPIAFAYPNGVATDLARARLMELGYDVAVLFDHRLAKPTDPMAVSRIRVNGTDDVGSFAARVSGVHPWVHRFLKRP